MWKLLCAAGLAALLVAGRGAPAPAAVAGAPGGIPAIAAAAPWSDPAAFAGLASAAAPLLAVTPNGAELVAYSSFSAPGPTPVLLGASAAAGGGFGPVRELARMSLAALLPDGADHVLAIGTTGLFPGRPVVSSGPAGGAFGAPRPLGPGAGFVLGAAGDARGDVAVLLRECQSAECGRSYPYLVSRRAGHAFGPAQRIDSQGSTLSGAVALDARGNALVTWARPAHGLTGTREVYARLRRADGSLAPVRRLGSAVPTLRLAAALGDDGHAVVGWLAQGVGEGAIYSSATIRVATAAPGHALGPAKTVGTIPLTATSRFVESPAIQITPDGALVAWTGFAGGHYVVRQAPVTGGELGRATTASPSGRDAMLAGVAVAPSGAVVVLEREDPLGTAPGGLVAIERMPHFGIFVGPLEAVSAPGTALAGATVGVAGDRFVAIWGDVAANTLMSATRPF